MKGIYSSNWYGKETTMLKRDPKFIHILLGMYDSKKWYKNKIDISTTKKPELKIICGEGNLIEQILYALGKNYKVSIISGGLKEDIMSKLKEPIKEGKVKLYLTEPRPEYHFSIIGDNYLYLEDKHEEDERPNSLGITDPYDLDFYKKYFQEKLSSAIPFFS